MIRCNDCITNVAFRRLCREYESPRSMRLDSVDPATMAEAMKIIIGEGWPDHIDTNWGRPESTR